MRISKPVLGMLSAVAGGLVTLGVLQMKGGETNPPARLNVQDTPINRESGSLNSFAPIIKRAAPSVVNIYSTRTLRNRQRDMEPLFNDPFFRRFFGDPRNMPERRRAESLGSGVIVSPDGYILTANHVVDGADEVKVALATGGREFTARIVGTDPPTDIAVLKVEGSDLPSITIANSDKLEVGDIVLAIGNPFNVGQTVTMGMVSALGRNALQINQYENFIQTDAAINPGNSGGALVDAEGRLIGINTAIYSRSGGYQGLGFAVPVNLARMVMERLLEHGEVQRGYIGVELQPEITPALVRAFNLPDTIGAMVSKVVPGTPAEKAGLENGDVIREVNGQTVIDRPQLRLLISQMEPGTEATLKVLRSERGRRPVERTIKVTLGRLDSEMAGVPDGRMGPQRDGESQEYDALDGVEVTDLDATVRRELGLPQDVRGALVTGVAPDSNSAEGGLREGDVILEINRNPVRNAAEAVELSRDLRGDMVTLRIFRQGSNLYLAIDNRKN